MRILVVEDERKTASFIQKALECEGFQLDWLGDGSDVLPALSNTRFDVMILDIMLPGLDGLEVLKQMREQHIRTPVLLVSARSSVSERVEGLNAGADDYLAKPFAMAELIARVRALQRRSADSPPTLLQLADLSLDTLSRRAERRGLPIELAPREYRLLEHLLRSAGHVCARMAIVEKVWDYDFDPGTNLVDVYIKRLREKIDAGHEVKLLHTVRGLGYLLKDPRK